MFACVLKFTVYYMINVDCYYKDTKKQRNNKSHLWNKFNFVFLIHKTVYINYMFRQIKQIIRKYPITISIATGVLLLVYWFILPAKPFKDPVCTVIEDRNGNLLAAHISADGQWRFPEIDTVPEKFAAAIIQFEDKRFNWHWGFDVLAFARAAYLNIKHGAVVSGGSTLTMQVVRLWRRNTNRTVLEKIIEIIYATRLEFSYSKDEILALYASHAPFGGNVVGIDAASWRYFGCNPEKLSWAEAATLAVLPNSPALIHPGRNRNTLQKKRDALLKKLYDKQVIDEDTYLLAISENVPENPKPFPQHAPHLLTRFFNDNTQYKNGVKKYKSRQKTTLDINLQKQVNNIIQQNAKRYEKMYIHNAAAFVMEVETGDVQAYVGNVFDNDDQTNGRKVDIITAERSTGSVLKPFLYAAMLSSGEILPNALVPDIPTYIDGYSPKNFNKGFDGAVPAHRALARSLNVPAVKMLRQYGTKRFHHVLQKSGLTTIRQSPDYYGLSLILGGCEGTLWEMCGVYGSMARSLNNYTKYNGKYTTGDWFMPNYLLKDSKKYQKKDKKNLQLEDNSLFSAAAIWLTFRAMLDVERPEQEGSWWAFNSTEWIAWKTGTSFGFRDAWAIGLTPKHVVGVWVGNADGEGRPEIVGVRTAAPVLFDIFGILPSAGKWFEKPYDDMIKTRICHESGFIASEICPDADTTWIPKNGERFQTCPYHKIVHLDKTHNWRVHSNCEQPSEMIHKAWFVLPPTIEFFYKSRNPWYRELPPYRIDCAKSIAEKKSTTMEIIYPKPNIKIYIPIDFDEKPSSTVFEVAHRDPETIIFWHIDNEFIGQTQNFHNLAVNPDIGWHTLTLIDENGEQLTIDFEILGKE